ELLEAGLLDVEHLAAQRQDRLVAPVAPLLGRAARGVTLDDEELRLGRILLLAVGELAGQAHAVQQPLATSHVARLARRLARAGGIDDLADDDLRVVRLLEEELLDAGGDDLLDGRAHFGRDQLVLRLRGELGLGNLHRQHGRQALAHVVAGRRDLRLLPELVLLDVLVDDPGHRRAQAREMGAAVALRNVVGEAEDLLVVGVVPWRGDADADGWAVVALVRAAQVQDVRVDRPLGAIDVLHEAAHAARAREVLLLALALVDELDRDAVVEEGELAQALGEDLVVVLDVAEDLGIRQEMHLGAALVGGPEDLHRGDLDTVADLDHLVHRHAALELDEVRLAVATHGEPQPARQRIDARDTDAVQAARDLVAVLVELAAGVQLGQRDLGGRAARLVLVVHLDLDRDAPTVVDDRDWIVRVEGDDDL